MTHNPSVTPRVRFLVEALCDGTIEDSHIWELESLLLADAGAREFYVDLLNLNAELQWIVSSHHQGEETVRDLLETQVPPARLPVFDLLGNAWNGLPQGVLFSYLLAAVIMGLAALVAWNWRLSDPAEIAGRSPPPAVQRQREADPKMPFVGRITGMIDCQWSDPNTAVPGPVAVPLGRKYALGSGLLEITYDTGAKVILQGPCTYEVESKDGGYLSIGKLTAKLEKKVVSCQLSVVSKSEIRNQKSETSNPQSLIPNPSLSTTHYPLFTIKTPTATVTDLGTEFGVEVNEKGQTTSHVFRGSVRLLVTSSDGRAEVAARVLHENESARVENGGEQGGDNRIKILEPSAKPTGFVREIPKRTITTLDLVDVVAGGDGFSGRRNLGIDPTTGEVSRGQPSSPHLEGDHQYHRVKGIPFVDGVFIPDGKHGPVQVDSSGNTSDAFFPTSNVGYGCIWAGASIPGVGPSELDGVDYGSPSHGALFLHANKGITFDLAAIRKAHPDYSLLRFRTMAGGTEMTTLSGCQDIWVLIDGRVRFRRRQINSSHGAYAIDIAIDERNHFLTLAGTDGGDEIRADSILFGDPRIELVSGKAADGSSTEDAVGH